MTVQELIKRLEKIDKDKIVVLYDGYGWSNIDKLEETETTVRIYEEVNPLFSDN